MSKMKKLYAAILAVAGAMYCNSETETGGLPCANPYG